MPQLNFISLNYFDYQIQPDGHIIVRPTKKIILQDGQKFELQEAYGLGANSAFNQDNEDHLCVVCIAQNKDVLCKPCRHVSMCHDCAKALMQ